MKNGVSTTSCIGSLESLQIVLDTIFRLRIAVRTVDSCRCVAWAWVIAGLVLLGGCSTSSHDNLTETLNPTPAGSLAPGSALQAGADSILSRSSDRSDPCLIDVAALNRATGVEFQSQPKVRVGDKQANGSYSCDYMAGTTFELSINAYRNLSNVGLSQLKSAREDCVRGSYVEVKRTDGVAAQICQYPLWAAHILTRNRFLLVQFAGSPPADISEPGMHDVILKAAATLNPR